MIVLEKGIMLDGTKIQIEEWNENYSFMPYGSTLASYPKSKQTLDGMFSPNRNETFRYQLDFKNNEETIKAFNDLLTGKKTLSDFRELLNDQEYLTCI